MQQLIERLKKINNVAGSIRWGSYNLEPLIKTDRANVKHQCILVVGHNVYHKHYTLLLEEFENETFRLRLMPDNTMGDIIADDINCNIIIDHVINKLKEWFPETKR